MYFSYLQLLTRIENTKKKKWATCRGGGRHCKHLGLQHNLTGGVLVYDPPGDDFKKKQPLI